MSRQPERLVLGITGPIGAGKTSVGKYLESAHGFHYLRYSQVLAEWLAADPTAKNQLQGIGWEVMAGGKQAELNARLVQKIGQEGSYAVDGLRHSLDHTTLRDGFAEHYHLLYIDSPPETRWRRLQARRGFATFADFQAADSHPVEQQIPLLRPSADFVLQNQGPLDELYSTIEGVLQQIHSGGLA
ncbi:MAG TPA: AAA family ATPase [Terriglobales bacterium]|nr:AAA family ATPase [Terriglobales bacterium]